MSPEDYPIPLKSNKPPERQYAPGERRVMSDVEADKLKRDTDERRTGGIDSKYSRNTYDREDAGGPEVTATTKRQERILAKQGRANLSKEQQSLWEKEGKRLGEWLRTNMVSRKAMALRKPTDPDFRRAVNHVATVENGTGFSQVASRWKNIMRQLHPGDPTAANMERLRRHS